MHEKTEAPKKLARMAGLLYLLVIVTSLYGHIYVPSQIFVKGDMPATLNNILAHEYLFRTCVVAGLIESIALLFLALTLGRLLREVHHQFAGAMTALAWAQVPIAFVIAGFKLTTLAILKDNLHAAIPSSQTSVLAVWFLNLARFEMTIAAVLGGLWLFPFGRLVFRSRFIPRIFGVMLLCAATVYIIESLIAILSPVYDGQLQILVFIFFLAEVSMMLWLLIKGVKEHVSIEVISESERTIRNTTPKMTEYTG
jgi:hypothetical protein